MWGDVMHRLSFACLGIAAIAATAWADDGDALHSRWQPIDEAVSTAIERGELPGAVVLVLHRGEIVLHRAYGQRRKQPEPTLMTDDTVFDVASLTKPIVTATALMLLLEDGKLKLDDPVAQHLPAFAQGN